MDIYVGNIPFKFKEKDIQALFEEYGEVSSVRIIKSQMTRQNKGFAFVDMPNPEEVRRAIFELNGRNITGRELEVALSEKKEEKPKPKKKFWNK